MLDFVDGDKVVRIFRSTQVDGRIQRTRLGVLAKNRWVIREDIKASLSADELAELQAVMERYQEVERTQRRVDILRFPVIVREVAAYFGTEATTLERRLISQALGDAIRVVRLSEKVEGKANLPAKNAEQKASEGLAKEESGARNRDQGISTGKRSWLRRSGR